MRSLEKFLGGEEFIICGSQSLKNFGPLSPSDIDILVSKDLYQRFKGKKEWHNEGRYLVLSSKLDGMEVSLDCDRFDQFGIGLCAADIFSAKERYCYKKGGIFFIKPEVEYVLENFRQRTKRLLWFKNYLIESPEFDWLFIGEQLASRNKNYTKHRWLKKVLKKSYKKLQDLMFEFFLFKEKRLKFRGRSRKLIFPPLPELNRDIGLVIQDSFVGNHFLRPDVVLKYLIFCDEPKKSQKAWIALYEKMMIARKGVCAGERIRSNIDSHRNRVNSLTPIEISREGFLLDGSHRLAGALARGQTTIAVRPTLSRLFAHDFNADLELCFEDKRQKSQFTDASTELLLKIGASPFLIDWGIDKMISLEICHDIKRTLGIVRAFDLDINDDFDCFLAMYRNDLIADWKVELKLKSLVAMGAKPTIYFIKPGNFEYRVNSASRLINCDLENFKSLIRRKFSKVLIAKGKNYFPDILMHSSDSPSEARYMYQKLVAKSDTVQYK